MRVTFERRLRQPRWLSVAVPVGSVVFAFLVAPVAVVQQTDIKLFQPDL